MDLFEPTRIALPMEPRYQRRNCTCMYTNRLWLTTPRERDRESAFRFDENYLVTNRFFSDSSAAVRNSSISVADGIVNPGVDCRDFLSVDDSSSPE